MTYHDLDRNLLVLSNTSDCASSFCFLILLPHSASSFFLILPHSSFCFLILPHYLIPHSSSIPAEEAKSEVLLRFTVLGLPFLFLLHYYQQNKIAQSEVFICTKRSQSITGRMRKQNLKTDPVPIDPDRVHIIQFHLWNAKRFLASRSCSGPLHYYRQNEEAKSEVLLSTKRSRSLFTLLPAEWGSKIWRLTQYQ